MWAAKDGHIIDDCTIVVVFLEMIAVNKPRPVTVQLGQPRTYGAPAYLTQWLLVTLMIGTACHTDNKRCLSHKELALLVRSGA